MTETVDVKRDFFVSYASSDEEWADWLAWAVEEAGWSLWFQKWDFRGSFVLQMDRSNDLSDRTIGLLSASALSSRQVQAEWDARRADDPRNERESLILIKVGPCKVPGLLRTFIWLDLSDLQGLTKTDQEVAAKAKLVAWLKGERLKPGEAPPLPPSRQWETLCSICKDITHHRMAAVRGKYIKALYLERDTVRQHVEAFLADPQKRGFILVGKSGVGKSNFLLALEEELRARSNICVLMYDGGSSVFRLSTTLTDIIRKDFRTRSWQPARQLWEEIAQINCISERLVVLCVDALNENTHGATDLLRQLDELVQSPWPWFKVIFSSRPETWRSIKSGVKLAQQLYYRAPGSENLGIELTPFSYSARLEIFPSEELPQVYSKYHDRFQLPDYADLSPALREALRDPLNLSLLATIVVRRQQDKPLSSETIIANLKPYALIEEYVYTEEVLHTDDRRFLEKRLVPLMLREGRYKNVITEEELRSAEGGLYEGVCDDHVLHDARRTSRAFLKLRDADILVMEQQETEQGQQKRIKFKYERFYEYFAGKALTDISETQTDRHVFFLGLIKEASGKPFFWGAVRNALVREAGRPDAENILKLCRTTEQRVKEMMVNVLVGLDSIEQVERLLRKLIPQQMQASEWQKVWQLVSKSVVEADPRTRSSRKIAIEVASTLKLTHVLQTAALHRDPTMRAMAVRYGYYLWQHDQDAGFEFIQYLGERATTGMVPNSRAIESLFSISLIVVCNDYQEQGVLSKLRGILHGVVADLFRVREGDNRGGRVVREFINGRLIDFIISHIFILLRELPPNNMMNYEALQAFFRLTPQQKALYRQVVRYLDITGDYSKEQMEQDYVAVLKIDNVLPRLITTMGLAAHACAAPHAFLPFLRQLFEAAKNDVAAYPYLTAIYQAPLNVLHRDPTNDEMFEFFMYTGESCQDCYTSHPEKYHNLYAEAPQTSIVGTYILFQYRRTGNVRTAWLETRIQAALRKPDLKFFELLLNAELPVQALDQKEPKATLAALELFFDSGNAEITDMIQAFLSRVRLYYPDEVDEFLAEQQAPDEFSLRVRTHEPVERVGDLIGSRGWYFFRESLLLGAGSGGSQLVGFFERAAECGDTREWMNYVIRHLVNLIYGGQVLRES